RDSPGMEYEKSRPCTSCRSSSPAVIPGRSERMNCRMTSLVSGGDSTLRICPRLEVKVGGILFHGELDQLIEVHEMLQEMTCEPHVRIQSIRAARLSQETHAEAGVRLRVKDRSLGTPVQN